MSVPNKEFPLPRCPSFSSFRFFSFQIRPLSDKVTRDANLGLPSSWSSIAAWFEHSTPLTNTAPPPPISPPRLFPQIPTLPDYHSSPPPTFWTSFPYRPLPPSPTTPVNQSLFGSMVHDAFPSWSFQQRTLGQQALHSICHGAQPRWTKPLPGLFTPNTPSAYLYGPQITDTIAAWITKGFVAGPFLSPPLPNFRVNPLLAIPQHDKVRLVLNLSAPTGVRVMLCLGDRCLNTTLLEDAYAMA